MKSEELKRIQAPLKAKYRDQAQTALVTLKAKGKIGNLLQKIDTGRALVEVGMVYK